MEIFLAVTSIATLVVLIIDTEQKRYALLCRQEHTQKKR
jgi:hypothetical protein